MTKNMVLLGMCVLAMGTAIAACGESPSPPNAIIQNYLNALGAGNYVNACGFLDKHARQVYVRSKRRIGATCPEIFSRCLPHKTIVPKQDQTQLLYAEIDVTRSGSTATAAVSRTLVANELKHVRLKNDPSGWKLTGFGQAIEQCRVTRRHRRHKTSA